MKGKLLKTFETARDYLFTFICYIIVFLAILTFGIMFSIKAPGLLKFIGVIGIIGAIYFLLYFPTFIQIFKSNKDQE